MVTRRYQRDYQKLNLHKTIQWSQEDTKEIIEPKSTQDNTMVTRRYQRDYQNLNLHTDNTTVTRRYQRDDHNLNLHKTIQWPQEDTKAIIRT